MDSNGYGLGIRRSTMSTPELRKLHRRYYLECDKAYAKWQKKEGYPLPMELPTYPEELRGMTCSAKTRAGTPCKQKRIYINGRCKLHGGLSTGPRTKRGKRRSSLNWKKRKIFIRAERTP
jgi:hypothetical protein